jgi:hypothetical protein
VGYLNISVRQHFYSLHKINLAYPYMRCLTEQFKNGHLKFYPLELLEIYIDLAIWARVHAMNRQKHTDQPVRQQVHQQRTDEHIKLQVHQQSKDEQTPPMQDEVTPEKTKPKRGRHFHRLECDCSASDNWAEYESCNDENCPYSDDEDAKKDASNADETPQKTDKIIELNLNELAI